MTYYFLVAAICSLLFAIFGAFVLQGLRKIPANPPHKAIVTRFGKRTAEVKDEGWNFFPFYPYWHGYILVNVTKVNHDLPPQLVRTPDMAELEIPISLTWTPINNAVAKDENGQVVFELKDGLTNFLNAGGEKGVKEILDDIVRERLREWAMSDTEGPLTWIEALNAREDAINVLMKSIVGERLEAIEADIPTSILLRFYHLPSKTFRKKTIQEERDEKDWAMLDNYRRRLGQEEEETLRRQTERRKIAIAKMRQGNGGQLLPQLGIRLDRLNIDEIKPRGELAKAAEKKVTEQREMEGDKVKIGNLIARIKELVALDFSREQALEIIQTSKGQVKKEISEFKGNLSQETREMIERVGSSIIDKILAKTA